MGIYVSERHGVNPSLEKCFLCGEAKGVVLFGKMTAYKREKMLGKEIAKQASYGDKGTEDVAAPREVVIDMEPCDKCKGYMKQGIILISVDEEKSKGDMKNPYRTGGWCVVKEEAIRRWLPPGKLLADIIEKRVAFLPDETWDMIGLPRGGSEQNTKEGTRT